MKPAVDPRLDRLLGGEALAALRQRLRRHFERTSPDAPAATVRIGELAPHEHAALASLAGRTPRGSNSMQIDIAVIDTALRRAGIAASLRDALERLDGGIVHRATALAEARLRWSSLAAGCRHAGLARLLGSPAGLGLLKRLAHQDPEAAARLRDRAEAVLQRLPADGLARAQLAAETLGDAHALDDGQATATLVLAARRQANRSPDRATPASLRGGAADVTPASAAHDAPDDAPDGTTADADLGAGPLEERSRDVWARAGVLVNELARPALFLNLPTQAGTRPVAPMGEPGYASLRLLLRSPPAWAAAGLDVHVCENPNLLAIAADRLGERCAPLVCTDGMPAAAQRTLLAQLATGGAHLHYHGDFDWPGLQIANRMLRVFGALPWRFGAAEYLEGTARAPDPPHPLAGAPVAASWDAGLAPAMQAHGMAIAEEGLADSLLPDLQRAARR